MKLQAAFVALVALALQLSAPPAARADETPFNTAKVGIQLPQGNSDDLHLSRAGLVYGGNETVEAQLVFKDAADRDLGHSCPVIVKMRSLGATAILAGQSNGYISLSNTNGKSMRQLTGSYYGLNLGAVILPFGMNATLAANGTGVIMRDVAYMMGLGLDLSIPKVSIIPDNARMSNYPGCVWDRQLKVSGDYTGEAGPTSSAAVSDEPAGAVSKFRIPAGKPGEDHKGTRPCLPNAQPVNAAV